MSEPKYALGDYLIIYSGFNEGCCFTVRGVRRAPPNTWQPWRWEYDTGAYGWLSEGCVCTEAYARLFP